MQVLDWIADELLVLKLASGAFPVQVKTANGKLRISEPFQ
jgi:hypothetical protein